MKALILLLTQIIIIGSVQLEAQIQPFKTKPLQPIIEVVILKPTKNYHEKTFGSSHLGRFVIDNNIEGDYVPFKSAFAKKNEFFLNWMNAVERNRMTPSVISGNKIVRTSIFPKKYQKFQYLKKKADKVDVRIKINKTNAKDNKFIETLNTVKLSKASLKDNLNLNSSETPPEVEQKINDSLKFHIFSSNSSEPLKEPKLHEIETKNSSISNLNSSKIPIEIQKLNDKIDFLKFHLTGSPSSEPKLSLKKFINEMKLELDSRQKSNTNNLAITLKNISQEVQKLTKEIDYLKNHLLPQQDIDDSDREISPSSPNHPKNRISNELQLPRDLYAFVFNYKKIVFNRFRLPHMFKSLVPDYLKIPKYQEKVNRSLPKLKLPFEKYENFIKFVETDDKLLPQAITLFFGELPPMPAIPARTQLKQIEKRSTNLIILPLIHKTIEFRTYNEKNETIYKVHDSYWQQVKAKLSIKFFANNTAKELEPFLPGFYRSLNFTTDPDDLLPHQIKWLKIFIQNERYGPRRNKTYQYRYEFEDYNAERNLNYLLTYFKQMRQDVIKQYLEMGGHGLPRPEQTFAFLIEVPDDEEPDFENIIYWGTELITPRYHKLHQFNDTYEEQEPSIEQNEIDEGDKIFQFNEENIIEETPRRTKRWEQIIPIGDPGLPPQILLAQAFVSSSGGKNVEELSTKFANNSASNETKSEVVLNSSKTPSVSELNNLSFNGHKNTSTSKSEYISDTIFSNIEEYKPIIIHKIIEIANQGKNFIISKNPNFPRNRYIRKRKNPLPKGIKKITINYDVPVYLDNKFEPHQVDGPPVQHRSRRSTIFESVFGDHKKSFPQRFYEAAIKNDDDPEIRSKNKNTKVETKKAFNIPTKIDSKDIVYGFPEMFLQRKKSTTSPVDKSKKISKITINYGVPVYFKPYNADGFKTSKPYPNNVALSLPKATKSRTFIGEKLSLSTSKPYLSNVSLSLPKATKSRTFVEKKRTSNLPLTTNPKPFVVSDVKILKLPVANSSKISHQKSTIIGETTSYSYYLGPNPANITISHDYYSQKETGKPQKVYGVPRIKRSSPILSSVFGYRGNFKPLQQIFLKEKVESSPVHQETFPTESSNGIQRNKLPITNTNIRFNTVTSNLVLPKSDGANLSLPKNFHIKSFDTKNFQFNKMSTENLKTSDVNDNKVSPASEKVENSSKNNDRLPNLDSPKTFNSNNTENDPDLYRLSLPSSYTRYLNIFDNTTEPPQIETFEPRLVSNFFFMHNVTDYQRLHYYLVPKMERSESFSRSKRSTNLIFASVFNNDRSKSLQQRFYEGRHRNHQHKPNCKHKYPVGRARLQYIIPISKNVPFVSHSVQNYAVNSRIPSNNGMLLPRIRLTKIFKDKLKARPFVVEYLTVPIVDKSKLFSTNSSNIIKNPLGIVKLQVPSFKSVSFGSYIAPNVTQIPKNVIVLPKLEVNKHFTDKYTTLTLPLRKKYEKVTFEQKLPIGTKNISFGDPLAVPIVNKSKLFSTNSPHSIKPATLTLPVRKKYEKVTFEQKLPIVTTNRSFDDFLAVPLANKSKLFSENSPNTINNHTNWTTNLQIPNTNEKNIFLEDKNATKHLSVPGTKSLGNSFKLTNQSNSLDLTTSNPNFVSIKPEESYIKLPKTLVNNVNNNGQLVSSKINRTHSSFSPKNVWNRTIFSEAIQKPGYLKALQDNIKYNAQFSIGIAFEKNPPKEKITKKSNTSVINLKITDSKYNNSFVQKVPLKQSVYYLLETSKNSSHLPKVASTKSFSLESLKNFSGNINLPKESQNNLFIQEISHLKKIKATEKFKNNNSLVVSDLPKIVSAKKNFTKNLQIIKQDSITSNLPEIPKKSLHGMKFSNLPKVPKALEENIKYNSQFISVEKEQIIKNGQIFNQKSLTNNTPTNFEEHKNNISFNHHNALEAQKNDTEIKYLNPKVIATVSTNLPVEQGLKIPKTNQVEHFNPESITKLSTHLNNSHFFPIKTKYIQNLLSENSSKAPKVEKNTKNFSIKLQTVNETIGNDLTIPKTGLLAQKFNTKNITTNTLPTNNKIDIKNTLNTENSVKIPKTVTSKFNPKNNSNIPINLPIVNMPRRKIPKTRPFNLKTTTNLSTNQPKAIDENKKYNSQFIPIKTDNPKTTNASEILKSKPQFLIVVPEINETISQENTENAKVPSTIQFEIPKIPKGNNFQETIRQNKTFAPALDDILKENIAYNAEFVKQLNVSHKNPEVTVNVKKNVTKLENLHTNQPSETTTVIEQYEIPKENSSKPFLVEKSIPNFQVTNQTVKHYRKRPGNIVLQQIKNKILESSRINKNRADIPIEEETSQIKNPLYVANRANYSLSNKGTIKTNNTRRVNIRKKMSNLYNVNGAKSRFIIKDKTLKNNTEDALDNDNDAVISENGKKKVLVKIIRRPSQKNIEVENAQ